MDTETTYFLARLLVVKSLGFVYFLSNLGAYQQTLALCGSRGLLPAAPFLKKRKFWAYPSLFHLNCSDGALKGLAALGMVLSVLVVAGAGDLLGYASFCGLFLGLWLIQLSYLNIGQTFYGYSFELLLAEIGFAAAFLGPAQSQPSQLVVFLLRCTLFSVMFGPGIAKLGLGYQWRDLSAMQKFYETHPLPSRLSWYISRLPKSFHKLSTLVTLIAEVGVPFFYFAPAPYRYAAGGITLLFQIAIIATGNIAWFNYATAILCVVCFDDRFFTGIAGFSFKHAAGLATLPHSVELGLAGVSIFAAVIALSHPLRALLAWDIRKGDPFYLNPAVRIYLRNIYYMFRFVKTTRTEYVLEGYYEGEWKEILFKGRVDQPGRMPLNTAPYFHRLAMTFFQLSPQHPLESNEWVMRLIKRLLDGEPMIRPLLTSEFAASASPAKVRALLYEYKFTRNRGAKKAWWSRRLIGQIGEEFVSRKYSSPSRRTPGASGGLKRRSLRSA